MTVTWLATALDRLADIWVTATPEQRDVIERTVNQITARLSQGGHGLGESRKAGERVWFHHPLVVRVREVPGEGVFVTHVAALRPGRSGGNGGS